VRAILSPRAKADLVAIGDYIADDNPARAATFVDEVGARCQAIADAPHACTARPELGRGIRACPHGSYLILYRSSGKEVQVIRILHAARDLRDLARRGQVSEPAAAYALGCDFEALGFLSLRPSTKHVFATARERLRG
jgi:toxin ParE1/3/4